MMTKTEERKAAAANRRRELLAAAKSKNAVERAEMLAALGSVRNVDGRELSEKNLLLLAIQAGAAGLPSLSMVGGFRQWKAHGRAVRKGCKGLLICFPLRKGGGDSSADDGGDDDGADDDGSGGKRGGMRFGWSFVWDISQTVAADDSAADSEINSQLEDDMSKRNGESAENLNLFNKDLFELAASTAPSATAATATAAASPAPSATAADDPAAALMAAFSAA